MRNQINNFNLVEVIVALVGSALLGAVRFLYLLRQGRQFKWYDVILEPCLATFGGLLMWAINEATETPDIMQAVFTSLGAWGGPRTIHYLELKYLGGTRVEDESKNP